MGWTKREEYLLAVLIVLTIVFIAYTYHRYKWTKDNCICSRPDGFSGDLSGWPTAGTFGNLADTNPYGNYADGQVMFWPTYDERNGYWSERGVGQRHHAGRRRREPGQHHLKERLAVVDAERRPAVVVERDHEPPRVAPVDDADRVGEGQGGLADAAAGDEEVGDKAPPREAAGPHPQVDQGRPPVVRGRRGNVNPGREPEVDPRVAAVPGGDVAVQLLGFGRGSD
jgi:hypothetical protein